MPRRLPMLTALAVLAASATAFAASYQFVMTGDRHGTTVTGYDAPTKDRILNGTCDVCPSDDWALRAITILENADTPVFVVFDWTDIKSGGATRDKGYPRGSRYGKAHKVEVPTGFFVNKVQVCTNDKGTKSEIKGVRVWGFKFGDQGILEQKDPVSFEQPNCAKWTDPSTCPVGEMISDVYVAHDDQRIQGLKVACRVVTRRR